MVKLRPSSSYTAAVCWKIAQYILPSSARMRTMGSVLVDHGSSATGCIGFTAPSLTFILIALPLLPLGHFRVIPLIDPGRSLPLLLSHLCRVPLDRVCNLLVQ